MAAVLKYLVFLTLAATLVLQVHAQTGKFICLIATSY